MQTSELTLGFIGLGNMGGGMAACLLRAGHRVHVYDISAPAMAGLQPLGAQPCDSARAVGDAADIVFCCLPAPEISLATAKALAGSARCKLLVEASTTGRPWMLRIEQAAGPGIELLDCPVSGGRERAHAGQLSAITAGPPQRIDRVRPLLAAFAKQIFVVGTQTGQAQVCKLANNAISITGLVVACEAVAMGMKAGLDPHAMIEAINASTGRNSATVDKFPKAILPRNFSYGGPLTIGSKDLHLYLEEAQAQQASSLAVSNAAQLWDLALAKFGPQGDMTLMMRMLEEWAGLDAEGKPCR